MLICLKYSHDGKDIQILPFNDATNFISISSDNVFWFQKTTNTKYKIGEIAENTDLKISNEPICVFDSENICHYRLFKFFLENYIVEKN